MRDCSEGEDEAECGDEDRIQDELNLRYRMSRFNRYDDFYDNWDGDWAWLEANIDEDREQVRGHSLGCTEIQCLLHCSVPDGSGAGDL